MGTSEAGGLRGDPLQLFEVTPVNRRVLAGALTLGFRDFEDAVYYPRSLAEPDLFEAQGGDENADAILGIALCLLQYAVPAGGSFDPLDRLVAGLLD